MDVSAAPTLAMPGWASAQALAVPLALLVDWRWGEPPARVHPVVAMGRYLGMAGPWLVTRGPAVAFAGGAMAWLLGAAVCGALGWAVAHAVGTALPAWTGAVADAPGPAALAITLVQALLLALALKPMLAWRMLHDEVGGVEQGLAQSLDEGRQRLGRLVSRDVRSLDADAVRESALESLAENLNDSVVAPLFWFCVAGLPGAAVYRFANTADAMWGYRGRYEWAGKWAARADDVLSWLPARLTALLLCAGGGRWPGWGAMRRQAGATPSPNGGWPMGTLALLLRVRLRKPQAYCLNEGQPSPVAEHTLQALAWTRRAVGWGALAASLLALTRAGGAA